MTCKEAQKFSASAPGKVLITGGYLVLDRQYQGCVVATEARFVSEAQVVVDHSKAQSDIIFTVRSPQFKHSLKVYKVSIVNDQFHIVLQKDASQDIQANPFVEFAIQYAVMAASLKVGSFPSAVAVTLKADNDFYSQSDYMKRANLRLTRDSLKKIPPFNKMDCTLNQVHKTGLGSSAALVTSLVTCVYSSLTDQTTVDCNSIHNLAQFVHCLAQGKVGSGFDVSSAVFGSQSYRRFDPQHLSRAIDIVKDGQFGPRQLSMLISSDDLWTQSVKQFQLPSDINLILADVHGGSNTPGMVKQVLQWQRDNIEDSARIWAKLDDINEVLLSLLTQLSILSQDNPFLVRSVADFLGQRTLSDDIYFQNCDEQDAFSHFINIRKAFDQLNELMAELTVKSGVPILPDQQRQLLQQCLQVPGVIAAACPGAGGYDAIFCLVVGDKALQSLEEMWSKYKDVTICPLLSGEVRNNQGVRLELLPVFQENDKCRSEPVIIQYQDLIGGKNLTQQIEIAFGDHEDALGLLLVRGVPGFVEKRQVLLPLASKLAHLSSNTLSSMEDPVSKYMFGWSHGKERMTGDRVDFAKGSFYANPICDVPTKDQNLIDSFPEYCHPNIWPSEFDLRSPFRDLGQLMMSVAGLVAAQCDLYLSKQIKGYEPKFLQHMVNETRNAKARLLHYFPTNENDGGDLCGWHLDHSCLTALTAPMILDESVQPFVEVDSASQIGGLHIRSRNGNIVRVEIPEDCIAFQTGQALEIASSDFLKATPHCVKPISNGYSRNTLALFIQPDCTQELKPGLSFIQFTKQILIKHY